MSTVRTADGLLASPVVLRRAAAVVAGALLVALSAQVAIPVPGTYVPITLQVPAVLIVGGLLGPGLAATSLALYLVMGGAGLPVFAAGGVLGLGRLLGPTGGYLLALPVAAAIIGRLAVRQRVGQVVLGLILATLVIHAGGVAQLAVLTGNWDIAFQMGSLPFLLGDLVKLVFAGLIILRFAAPMRRALH
jgi:biotin transport system substrate-specific component